MPPHVVIVGGGPAGLEAARAYRETGGEGGVTLISADEFAPYNRPPLSKDFLRGESDESDLPLEEGGFYKSNEIDVLLDTRATALRPHQHRLTLSDGTELEYHTCILATGAIPTPLPARGAQDPGVPLPPVTTRRPDAVPDCRFVPLVGGHRLGIHRV